MKEDDNIHPSPMYNSEKKKNNKKKIDRGNDARTDM